MLHPKNISILDYTYELPDERIALHPMEQRDASRLLIYHNREIKEDIYRNIAHWLPENSLLVFNDTKVIKARIRFQKPTGGVIEIFCLEPYEDISEYSSVMAKKGSVRWKCMIGGASKWKKQLTVVSAQWPVGNEQLILNAKLIEKLPDAYVVEFSWEPANYSFAAVLEIAGDIPLPPYIKRKTDTTDTERYQTIYAREEGSVAAPTAGLHFTPSIFDSFASRNISIDYVTLHVGVGTFKPVKAALMEAHEMHSEWIDVNTTTIQHIRDHPHPLIAIGTTSLRTLESIYWMGVKALLDPDRPSLSLDQWEVYETPLSAQHIPVREAMEALLAWLKKNELDRLFTTTQILIAPGYRFRLANAIISNFHQPQSTLLLLVAAAVGDDQPGGEAHLPTGQAGWKKIYSYALENDFRFLSYGDGCLLFIDQQP